MFGKFDFYFPIFLRFSSSSRSKGADKVRMLSHSSFVLAEGWSLLCGVFKNCLNKLESGEAGEGCFRHLSQASWHLSVTLRVKSWSCNAILGVTRL
jgi:hypothetical protein